MGSNSAVGVPDRVQSRKEVIVGFDPESLRAPFFLRCGAAIIDYLLIILIPVGGLLLSRFLGNDGTRLVNSEINNFAWLLAILVAVCNFVLLPAVAGQSIGKMFTGLRVVKLNGESPGTRRMLLRQLLGYPLTLGSGGLGFFISVLNAKGRALHDYISGTVVVYGKPRVRS